MSAEALAAIGGDLHRAAHSPEWLRVRAKLREEVDRILDVTTIEAGREANDIAVEVRARKLAHHALTEFLSMMAMYERDPTEKKPPLSRFR